MSSAKIIVKCILSGTQQKSPLPSAAETTLGKIMALGIPNSLPSAEKRPLGKLEKNTRQNTDTRQKNHNVDIRQLVCLPLGVCQVSVSGTRQRSKFVECFPLKLGKEIILLSVFLGRGK